MAQASLKITLALDSFQEHLRRKGEVSIHTRSSYYRFLSALLANNYTMALTIIYSMYKENEMKINLNLVKYDQDQSCAIVIVSWSGETDMWDNRFGICAICSIELMNISFTVFTGGMVR
ncbi:hypothetical protein ACJX0J_008009, partial [Zea mays]